MDKTTTRICFNYPRVRCMAEEYYKWLEKGVFGENAQFTANPYQ